MKKFVLFFFYINIFLYFNSLSQTIIYTNSIDEATDTIKKIRVDAYNYISEKKYGLLDTIINTRISVQDSELNWENQVLFNPREITLFNFLTKNFKEILFEVNANYDYHNEVHYLRKNLANILVQSIPDDSLQNKLLEELNSDKLLIINAISLSDHEPDVKEFLILYFETILTYTDIYSIDTEYFINKSQIFLNQYPESSYSGYVEDNLYFPYKISKTSVSFDFSAGCIVYKGNLSTFFSNSVLFNTNLKISRNRITTSFSFNYSPFSKVIEAFRYQERWEKDSRVKFVMSDFYLGYSIIKTKKLQINPQFGIGVKSFSMLFDEGKDETMRNIYLTQFPSYSYCLDVIFKLNKPKRTSDYESRFIGDNENQYWYLLFKAGYTNPMIEKVNERFTGNCIFFSLGIGIWSNPAIRKKD